MADPTRLKVLLAVLIWGASFSFTKRALAEVSPLALVLARCGLGSLFMLVVARTPRLFRGLAPKEWLQLAAISASGVVGQQTIQAFALRHTSANHAGWILAATPIAVALAMALFFGERMGLQRWSGFGLGAAGTLLVILSRQLVAGAGLIPTGRGDFLVMLSCFNWALYVIMMDRWLKSRSQRDVTVMSMVAGFAFMAAAALAGGQAHELWHVSAKGWACLAYLGLLSSGLGYLFWNAGVEKIGPSASAAFLYLEPLAALAAGRLMLGEGIAATSVLGGALILTGVYWVNAGRKLPETPEEAA
ncbi:MAG: DMT family transporter [Elusimicrobia bacterium]|nr:DMT family transporter [Elusimicrobiota bacterium]